MKYFIPFLLLAIFTVGCQEKPVAEAHEEGAEAHEEEGHVEGLVELDEEQIALAGIRAEAVSTRLIQPTMRVPGLVTSTTKGRAVVTPPVAGRVISILVSPGSKVLQGQALAIIDSADLAQSWANIAEARRQRDAAKAAVKETQAEVDLAQSKLSAATSNLKRQRELAQAGAFSQAPVQQAQSELNDAQSELLSIQKEQASHADLVRRLETLYQEGIVSEAEYEAAKLELQQDEIKLSRAKSRVAAAKTTYEREKNIAERGLLNAREIQTAEAEVRSSQLEVGRAKIRANSAKASLESANKAVSNAEAVYRSTGAGQGSGGKVTLRAPITGTVTHLDITKGQAVDRTQTLMEIENLDAVWVTGKIPEKLASKIHTGSYVTISVDAYPQRDFRGMVQIVGDRVDPETRSIPVQCLVTGANGLLKPDMFAQVEIATGKGSEVMAIPESALVKHEGETFVFVQQDHGYLKKMVEIGKSSSGYLEVLSGLEPGDPVVVEGAFVLSSELQKSELKGHDH